MKIKTKTKFLEDGAIMILENLLSSIGIKASQFVDEIIICDDDELEQNIMLVDSTISVTKCRGCQVLGKTVMSHGKIFIFLVTDILNTIKNDLSVNDNMMIGTRGIQALKIVVHEIGHAKIIKQDGKFEVVREHDNYRDYLNQHWKILRDEFLAEMFCANLYKSFISVSWYGDFDDVTEEKNFIYYLNKYKAEGNESDSFLAFELLHQYYFIQLFQKAGFLVGLKQFIDIENILISETVSKIMGFNVISNIDVPVAFNSLVLEKWEELQIAE